MNEIFGSIVTIIVVWLLDYFLPGIHFDNFWWLIAACFVIAFVNYFIKPLFDMILIPFRVLTFGLFNIVINSFMVYITAWLLPGFQVFNWWSVAIFAIVYYSTMTTLHSFDVG